MPIVVAATIPPTSAIPITFRAVWNTPLANTSGKTPRINAVAVIIIGLARSSAASTVALVSSLPDLY